MKILEFSWKDISHPQAGGAELVTDRYLSRLAADGHPVTLFCSAYAGCASREVLHGYKIVRRGNRLSVYLWALHYYLTEAKGNFDLIIDQINTLPFFTPLFARERIVAFIHQFAKEYWFFETPPLISHIGCFAEPFLLSAYAGKRTITVSNSTRAELESIGFRDVVVVPNGLDMPPLVKPVRKKPLLAYVGRVTRAKRVDHAIEAFAIVHEKRPEYRLAVIGAGPKEYADALHALSSRLGVADCVDFLGKVGRSERDEVMAESAVLINPSVREGWGMVILEANARGTPAAVYDVPGLRDSVRDGLNGVVGKAQNPRALADAILRILESPDPDWGQRCIAYARQFDWESSYKDFARSISAPPASP
ncbi:MAG: glycosyltransferase family 4 protein [Pseudomonadota bacterium]